MLRTVATRITPEVQYRSVCGSYNYRHACCSSSAIISPSLCLARFVVKLLLVQPQEGSEKYRTSDGRLVEIRNVWADNVEAEMRVIRELVERYPYVAMVRHLKGVVFPRPCQLPIG